MDVLTAIRTRRSVRHFTGEPVGREILREIVAAGTRAPSGLNNQPWRFVIACDPQVRESLAQLTKYSRILREAPAAIAVFIDLDAMYDPVKDHQGIGACLQNMLLAAHAHGLGAVWLGEILKNAPAVRDLLGLPEKLELMAVVALGHPARQGEETSRQPLETVLLKEV